MVNLKLIPYVAAGIGADLDLYYGLFDLAEAEVGVIAALPITVFGYTGTTCSDANGDGVAEPVTGAFLDISAELGAYFQFKAFNKQTRISIDLDLAPFGYNKRIKKDWPLFYDSGTRTAVVYTKNLYYSDLLPSTASLRQPVLTLADKDLVSGSIPQTSGIEVGTRTCYPYRGVDQTYEINWGDGTANYVGPGGYVAHKWNSPGGYTVTALLRGDEQGREFDAASTSRTISVRADPPVAPPPLRPTSVTLRTPVAYAGDDIFSYQVPYCDVPTRRAGPYCPMSVTVDGVSPTGTVSFYVNGSPTSPQSLVNGSVNTNEAALGASLDWRAGVCVSFDSIVVAYSGDARNLPSSTQLNNYGICVYSYN
jgi:hypothetical protein